MNFVKITNRQINTLKNLPSNLNDSLSSQNISGLIVLDKQGQFKQTIFDFQTSSLEEFYVGKNNSQVQLYKHIKNENPRLYRVLTFEVINKSNDSHSTDFGLHLDSTNVPSIEQWIKCTIHSVYRKIFNHMVITPSDYVYAISIKKTYYYDIYHKKLEKKWKLKDALHYLIQSYTDIYHEYNGSKFEIPDKFNTFFTITRCKNNDLLFTYKSFNEGLAKIN